MVKCLFERATGEYVSGARHDDLLHNPTTHIQLELPDYPDRRTERWDGADGVRPATQTEIDAWDAEQPEAIQAVKRQTALGKIANLPGGPIRDAFDAMMKL